MCYFRNCAPVSALAIVASALSGCIERKEHLTIRPDASILYQVLHKTDSLEELYDGDAVPKIAGGWMAEQREEKDADGKTTYTLVAETAFSPGANLPANYALAREADGDLYLQFPTTLKVEQRPDGAYYHFDRIYPARSWAQIEFLQKQLVQAPLEGLPSDMHDWTPQQRLDVIHALATFETEKMLVFARSAFLTVTPDAAQDRWLAVRSEMHDCLAQLDYNSLSHLLEPKDDLLDQQNQGKAIDAETKRFEQALLDRLNNAMKALAGYDGAQLSAFKHQYQRQKRLYEITQDLGDDKFEITVDMPGEITASNADSASATTATWTFSGEMLRDRELELMVTSRVK